MSSELYDSLLKNHEDTVTYFVPETERDGDQLLEIGLFSWKMDTVPLGTPVPENPSEREVEALLEHSDGIGLRVNPQSQRYKQPRSLIKNRVSNVFGLYSSGYRRGEGLQFRIEDGSSGEIRQVARELVLATFAYWWWLDTESEYDPYVKDVRHSNDQPEISHVSNDGVVVTNNGARFESPYSLSDIELLSADEYEPPTTTCEKQLRGFIQELCDEFEYSTVKQAYNNAFDEVKQQRPDVELTEARQKENELYDVVSEMTRISGIGKETRIDLTNRFNTVAELQEAIKTRDKELMTITQITPERVETMITVMQENECWEEES